MIWVFMTVIKFYFNPWQQKKTDGSKIPPLNPVDCQIFDFCASYIKEEFEDCDELFKTETESRTKILRAKFSN